MNIALNEREKAVFDMLADEQSKSVFLKRKKYAEDSGDCFSYTDRTYSFIDVFDKPQGFDETVSLLRSRPYVLYGFGFRGKNIYDMLKLCECTENCVGIWDNNPEMSGKVHDGITITRPSLHSQYLGQKDLLVVISVSERTSAFEIIKQELISKGIPVKNIICPYYVFYNFKSMYFDEEIIRTRLTKNEVFIDGGSCDFFSSKQLLEFNPSTKKIYAVEPNPECHNGIMKGITNDGMNRVVLIKCALWCKNDTINFTTEPSKTLPGSSMVTSEPSDYLVKAITIDEMASADEKVTFIKLDVEGSEIEALYGAAKTIERDKPKLAICVYHKPNDYYNIPYYIKELVPDYKIYMRQYKPFCDDTVLYAVL